MGTTYYLDHFAQVIEAVKQRYGFLLSPDEHEHIDRVEALSQPARMLYVRLANRRGPCFRPDKFSFSEIPAIESALAELLAANLLVPCDTSLEPELRLRLYSCFTMAELKASLRDHLSVIPLQKRRLLSDLSEWDGCSVWLAILLTKYPVIHVPAKDPWPFLRFLFFGDLRDNLADFVTRDLGYVVAEDVDPDKLTAQFHTRKEAIEAYRMATLYARFRAIRDTQPAHQTLAWWQVQSVDRQTLMAGVNIFDRLVERLGRRLERENALDAALVLYATSPVAPARERQARLLIKQGRCMEATELLHTMVAHPCHLGELYVAEQLLRRLAKSSRRSEARDYQRVGRRLALTATDGGVVSATLAHYRATGWDGVHSENWLWNATFGLLLWDVIYDPNVGAFHSPLQVAPADLHDPRFYDRRREAIEKRLLLLNTPAAALSVIERYHHEKAGLTNPFVYWQEGLLPLITIMINRLPPGGLASTFRRLSQDVKNHSRGFPDLFLWKATDYRFVEVKSENDQLSASQYQWLHFLGNAGIRVFLDNVQRERVSDQSIG
jgi:hypothetical protein